jgi:hypothetical protein
MTADMTFDGDNNDARNHEKSMNYNIQMVQPHLIDDDSDSTVSAEVSHTSKKPINGYYN